MFTQEFVDNIRKTMPELPDQKKERYIREFGLSPYDASVLTAEKQSAEYFETVVKGNDPKLASNWITAELFGRLNKLGKSIEDSPVSAKEFSGLVKLMGDNVISGKIAKEVLDLMIETGKSAADIVSEKGLTQITDTGAIEAIIDKIIAANPDNVAAYKSGKDKIFGFFVGQVMKETGGKANPAAVNELLKAKLS